MRGELQRQRRWLYRAVRKYEKKPLNVDRFTGDVDRNCFREVEMRVWTSKYYRKAAESGMTVETVSAHPGTYRE